MTPLQSPKLSKMQREVLDMLCCKYRGRSARQVIERLMVEGLLSDVQCKAYLVRHRVAERMRNRGEGKVEAMEKVAEQVGCSYYTVRNYLYKS